MQRTTGEHVSLPKSAAYSGSRRHVADGATVLIRIKSQATVLKDPS